MYIYIQSLWQYCGLVSVDAATIATVLYIYDRNDECVAPNIAGDDVLYV